MDSNEDNATVPWHYQIKFQAYQLEKEDAIRVHERSRQSISDLTNASIEFATIALKTVTIVSGGSVVVLLAFIGSIYKDNNVLALDISNSLFWFAASVLLGALATTGAYLTQALYAEAAGLVNYKWEFPYIEAIEPKAGRIELTGAFFHIGTIILVVASYATLALGAYKCHLALTQNALT